MGGPAVSSAILARRINGGRAERELWTSWHSRTGERLKDRKMHAPSDAAPTELRSGARTVRLKWHQVRRRPEDPPFARRHIADGLAAGASIEVDIRPLACGRFVCLHDPLLEQETTGAGPVAEADAATVQQLRMLAGGERPLLLEELAEIVQTSPAAGSAVVQLDFQTMSVTLEDRAVASFQAALEGRAERFIVSGYDWAMIRRLGEGVAGLTLGWDPSLEAAGGDTDIVRLVRETAPEADTIYLHRVLVRASHQCGDGLVARLSEFGQRVDCWTLDYGEPDAAEDLAAAIAAGCHQITTNTALAWANEAGQV